MKVDFMVINLVEYLSTKKAKTRTFLARTIEVLVFAVIVDIRSVL